MNVMRAIKRNTLEVNWSIQRFMEETKIIKTDFFFFFLLCVDFVFRKHLDTVEVKKITTPRPKEITQGSIENEIKKRW